MPAGFEPFPEPENQGIPTVMADAPAATQSTELQPPIALAKPSFDVRLTTVSSGAKIVRSVGNELEVQQNEMVDVQVDEGIKVTRPEAQEEQSYSILDFSDDLEVELFSDTSVVIAGLRQAAEGSTHATLHLNNGHLFVHLNDQASSGITVQTRSVTIKNLTSDAEFDVCHNEELTCLLVKKGVVEVTVQNRRAFPVRVGEAIYILKDQPPSPIICAPFSRFIDWEESYRQFADTPTLQQVLSELPQEPCPLNAAGIPVNARILYDEEFWNPFGGWARGKIDDFIVRYAGLQYYRVQAQKSDDRYLAFAPDHSEYGDVNVTVRADAETTSGGNFLYGLVLRRLGDQYYAFVISPLTQSWYFLKSSPNGLETLLDGTDERMRGLGAKETLRVEAYGSTFLLFINDRYIDRVSDTDYASGEVGLFVETIANYDAVIRFDSLIIWDVPPLVLIPDTGGREYCFNGFDDDGDRLADRSDPDCQRLGGTATPLPLSTNLSTAQPTSTPRSTETASPQLTNTPGPTTTNPPLPTSTARPTRTSTPRSTNTPRPTATNPPQSTSTPRPTRTSTPRPTNTPRPTLTAPPPSTSTPRPTATNPPQPTNTPRPTATNPPPTDPPPTDPPPTDPPPTDPPPTDPPPTDPPPTDPPPTDPPPTDPPPTDPPPTDPPPTDPPPTDPPPTDPPPTDPAPTDPPTP